MWVVLYSVIIFLTVPVARKLQEFVAGRIGKNAFIYFVLSVVGLGFLSLVFFLIVRLRIHSPSRYIWLLVLAGFYSYFILYRVKSPAEAIHFLEYGLLGFFLFRALKYQTKDISIFFTATLFSTLIGTVDEIIQWITPRRFWSFHDVWLNTLSGGLFLLGLWTVVKPTGIFNTMNSKSIRVFSYTFIICILLLGLCASNTPHRVAYYTNLMPELSFLLKEESMSEYGYKIKDPEIGVFFSRLSLNELEEADKIKGTEYAQIINDTRKIKYDKFLEKYNPLSNPFLHELRIHVYRRNKYFNSSRENSKLDEKIEFLFIAYKENLILEKYFGNTINASVYGWDEKKIHEVESQIIKSKFYKSPVSAHLFTSFTERTVWIFIVSLVFLFVIVNLILYYREEQLKETNI